MTPSQVPQQLTTTVPCLERTIKGTIMSCNWIPEKSLSNSRQDRIPHPLDQPIPHAPFFHLESMPSRPLSCGEADLRVCLPFPLLLAKKRKSPSLFCLLIGSTILRGKEGLRTKSKISNSLKFFNDWLYSTRKTPMCAQNRSHRPISNPQYDIIAHRGERRDGEGKWVRQNYNRPITPRARTMEYSKGSNIYYFFKNAI